jgi:predicted Fe-Mo cluster-binding NifX family protein
MLILFYFMCGTIIADFEEMDHKLLITIWRDQVAARFDLTSEVLVATVDSTGEVLHSKTVVLPTVSAEDLCHMILTEGITTVICGGIEEEYFQYLTWKRVKVIDSVIAPYDRALEFARAGKLEHGAILREEASQG